MPKTIQNWLLSLLLLLFLTTCAKTGDPLPPQLQLPPTINDLQVERAGPDALIKFRVPQGSDWVEIYRQCDPRTETDRILMIVRLAPDELVEADRVDTFQYTDYKLPPNASDCRYTVRFTDRRGQRSEYSNFASLP